MNLMYSDSLITQSIQKNIVLSSLNPEKKVKPVILDEQIQHLLESDGILCVPLIRSKEKVGAIVIGLNEQDEKTVRSQEKASQSVFSSGKHRSLC